MGRLNFGARLIDRKGLVGDIVVHDYEYDAKPKAFGFDIYSIELDILPDSYCDTAVKNAPAFYKYEFEAEETADTILHLKGFTRGVAFINGFNLGRHWTIKNSPNMLFIPAPLLRKGKNEIVVFDVLATDCEKKLHLGEFDA
jgi:beta-galactosidase